LALRILSSEGLYDKVRVWKEGGRKVGGRRGMSGRRRRII